MNEYTAILIFLEIKTITQTDTALQSNNKNPEVSLRSSSKSQQHYCSSKVEFSSN